MGWPEFYASGAIGECTTNPSPLVLGYADMIPPGSMVADIGCGLGRHARYFAELGHPVLASDGEPFDWPKELEEPLKSRISFEVANVDELSFGTESLGAVIAMRLFHYLSPEQIKHLADKTSTALQPTGLIIASFVVAGGCDTSGFDIARYQHDPADVAQTFVDAGLEIEKTEILPHRKSKHPSSNTADICELVASKAA